MRLKDDKSFPYVALDTRTRLRRALHHARQAREGRALLRALRRRARAAHDDGRTAPGLPAALVHQAQVQLPPAHRTALPALRHRQVLGPVRRRRSTPTATRELVASWARFFDGDVAPAARPPAAPDARGVARRSTTRRRPRPATASRPSSAPPAVQNVVLDDHSNLDVLAVASDGGRAAVVRFRVRFGRVVGRTRAPHRPLDGRGRRRDPRERPDRPLRRRRLDPRRSCSSPTRRRPRPSMREYLVRAARTAGRGLAAPSAASAVARVELALQRRTERHQPRLACVARATTTCARAHCRSSAPRSRSSSRPTASSAST